MKIIARKKSDDPNQEHLRSNKDLWNEAAKSFIYKTIAFKRGLNGRGDRHFGLPPNSIVNPFPQEIGSFLNNLVSDFSALVDGAERIMDEQEHYSEIRKKPLIVQSSWAGNRWLAKQKAPKDIKKPLSIIIDSSLSLKDKLIDMENYLTSSDLNGIPKAFSIALTFGVGPYKNIIQSFSKLAELNGKELKDPPKKKKDEEIETEEPATALSDEKYLKLINLRKDMTNMQPVFAYIKANKELTKQQKTEIQNTKNQFPLNFINAYLKKMKSGEKLSDPENLNLDTIFGAYDKMLLIASSLSFEGNSFADILNKIQQQPLKTESSHIVHDPVSRFFKRKILEYRPDFTRFDVDLDITKKAAVDLISSLLDEIENFLDLLIKEKLDVDEIYKQLRTVSDNLVLVLKEMISLAEHYITFYREEHREFKSKTKLYPIRREETNNLRETAKNVEKMSERTLQDKSSINIFVTR